MERFPLKQPTHQPGCQILAGKSNQVWGHALGGVVEVKVNEKAESVVLPCKTTAGLKENTVVEWIRSDPDFRIVHVFSNTSERNTKQDGLYRGRTEMNADLLRSGDLSLTLKFPTERDNGSYICTVYRDEDILSLVFLYFSTSNDGLCSHSSPREGGIRIRVCPAALLVSILRVSGC
uniref:Ig-like domain-containing protein n=1 Tax=Poecilia latipinna TaxID=48699 RepID=A0A3B3TS26_9TELE